jgi:predicted permease
MLVVGEVALAILLAIGAELMASSFKELEKLDPGFRTSNVVSARLTPAAASYSDAVRTNAFYETVIERVAAMHGVTSAGAVSALPLAKPTYGMGIRVEGQFEDFTSVLPSVDHFHTVTPGYMPTIGIRLEAGREFTDQDQRGAEPVAIVSQSTAKHFWPTESAIGKRIGYPFKSPWLTIVGIVADVKVDSLRDPNTMSAYVPFDQRATQFGGGELTLVVRTEGDPHAAESAIREIVTSVDRTVPVSDIQTMTDVVAQSVAKPRFTAVLVGAFALVAVILGVVGIYGVMGYVVSQRAQELSIRAALGATARDILLSVLGRAATLAGVGAVIGIVAAVAAVRPLRALLYGVSASDPWSYALVALIFIGVAVVASTGPARRAAASNPVNALRGG